MGIHRAKKTVIVISVIDAIQQYASFAPNYEEFFLVVRSWKIEDWELFSLEFRVEGLEIRLRSVPSLPAGGVPSPDLSQGRGMWWRTPPTLGEVGRGQTLRSLILNFQFSIFSLSLLRALLIVLTYFNIYKSGWFLVIYEKSEGKNEEKFGDCYPPILPLQPLTNHTYNPSPLGGG